jgi:hypothetical protein
LHRHAGRLFAEIETEGREGLQDFRFGCGHSRFGEQVGDGDALYGYHRIVPQCPRTDHHRFAVAACTTPPWSAAMVMPAGAAVLGSSSVSAAACTRRRMSLWPMTCSLTPP